MERLVNLPQYLWVGAWGVADTEDHRIGLGISQLYEMPTSIFVCSGSRGGAPNESFDPCICTQLLRW